MCHQGIVVGLDGLCHGTLVTPPQSVHDCLVEHVLLVDPVGQQPSRTFSTFYPIGVAHSDNRMVDALEDRGQVWVLCCCDDGEMEAGIGRDPHRRLVPSTVELGESALRCRYTRL